MSDAASERAASGLAPDLAIVIFGAAVRPDGGPSTTLRRRVEAAAAFGLRHPGALYVPTGGVGAHGPSEASVMAALLGGFGIASEQILLEETGTDTLSSVLAVRRLLTARRGSRRRRIYAATSAYHLPRCVLLMRLAGLPARPCPPPAFPAARRWQTRWYWRLRECAAIPWDFAIIVARRVTRRL